MNLADILGGFVTGGVGGLLSGFAGVTAGGILVPLLILMLGKDQHVAQGISLVAQIVPTSLSCVPQLQPQRSSNLAALADLAGGRIWHRWRDRRPARRPCRRPRAAMVLCWLSRDSAGDHFTAFAAPESRRQRGYS